MRYLDIFSFKEKTFWTQKGLYWIVGVPYFGCMIPN